MVGVGTVRRVAVGATLLALASSPAAAAGPAGSERIEGRMVDASGQGMAGRVLVYANPGPGREHEPERVVATGGADRSGRFSVRIPRSGELAAIAAANGGYVNFTIVGAGSERGGAVGAPRRLAADGTWHVRRGPASVVVPATERLDRLSASTHVASTAGGGPLTAATTGCAWTPIQSWNAYTVVGELHTYADQSGSFTYGRTADSDISIGWSLDAVAWKISGTAHVGNSQSSSVKQSAGSFFGWRLTSQFKYVKYKTDDPMDCGGGFRYKIQATQWNSGMLKGQDDSALDGQCSKSYPSYTVQYGPNTSFHRSSNDFVTFGGAVKVGGATLSSQSGASTYVQLHFDFGRNRAVHTICGTNNSPTRSARVFSGG